MWCLKKYTPTPKQSRFFILWVSHRHPNTPDYRLTLNEVTTPPDTNSRSKGCTFPRCLLQHTHTKPVQEVPTILQRLYFQDAYFNIPIQIQSRKYLHFHKGCISKMPTSTYPYKTSPGSTYIFTSRVKHTNSKHLNLVCPQHLWSSQWWSKSSD